MSEGAAARGLVLSHSEAAPDGSTMVLHANGFVDADTYATFEEGLKQRVASGTRFLVLDFRGIVFLNSMAWGLILSQHKRLSAMGGGIAVSGLVGEVSSVFRLMGLNTVLRAFADVDAAVKGLGGAPAG